MVIAIPAHFELPVVESMLQPGGALTEQLNREPSGHSDRCESMMTNQNQIPDRQVREQAETTFDRNIVVVAGAGTGKTTLLVNRLIHLLVKEPHPVAISHIVAVTFTNKAATEMKVRLRERLSALASLNADVARSISLGC